MSERAQIGEWIALRDRQPDEYADVLVLFDGGDCRYDICYRYKGDEWVYSSRGHVVVDAEPTHWMSLPELP